MHEMIDFLEAQPARHCAPIPGMNVCADNPNGVAIDLPARGAAIAMSSADWAEKKNELDEACRILGGRCSLQVKQIIENLPSAP